MRRHLSKLMGRLPHSRRFYKDAVFRRVDALALAGFLKTLGVSEGMTLYVQAAFGNVGYFTGGPHRFLEMMLDLVGRKGTVVMPSFPFEGSMEDFVGSLPEFRLLHTPSRVGLLPEAMRGFPGAKRSLHPTHPVVAIGHRAADIVEAHQICSSPQGEGTPFAKVVDAGGFVLRIGAPAFPLAHHLQESVQYPNLFIDGEARLRCVDSYGITHEIRTRIYRKNVPFVLYMDGCSGDQPIPMNIADFPLIFPNRDEWLLACDATRRPAVQRLLDIRSDCERHGHYERGTFKGCLYDLFDLRPVFSFAREEMRTLIDRHWPHYDLSVISQRLRKGFIKLQ